MRLSERLAGLLLLLLLSLWLLPAHAVQLLPDGPASVDSAGHLLAWHERDAGEAPENPQAALDQASWTALPGAVSQGYLGGALWLQWTVREPGPAAREWRLVFGNALIDEVLVYRRDAAGAWRLAVRGGEAVPRAEWPIKVPGFAAALQLEPGRDETLLIRLRSKNSMLSTVSLQTPIVFGEHERREARFYSVMIGGYLTLLLVHILVWRMTHELHAGWYFFYLLTNMGVETFTPGQAQFLLDMPMALSDPLLGLVLCAHVAVGLCFSMRVLDLHRRWPRPVRRIEWGGALAMAGAALLILSGRYAQGVTVMQAVGMASLIGPYLVAAWLALRGDTAARTTARFYLLAFGVYLTAAAVVVMRNQGLLTPSFLVMHISAIGSAIHMLMMSGRMGWRYEGMSKEKAQAQQELADTVKAHNEHLSQQVAARTATLEVELERGARLAQELRGALDNERTMREEQRDFVAMVAHEFRTPLAIINTSAQQIARTVLAAPHERTVQRTENIRAASRRLVALVDDYLTVDRLATEAAPFVPRPVPLVALLREVAAEWLDESGADDSNIDWQLAADLPERLVCDSRLLKVAVRNLIANAHRHSWPGSAVEVAVHSRDGCLALRVSNHGAAIPREEIPLLFRKYFRGRQAQRSPGAGLGLNLVQRIAQRHGGEVSLEESGESGRVSFCLTVPLAAG